MKKYRTTIIALAVLVVVIAAFIVVMAVKGGDEGDGDSSSGTSTTTTVSLFNVKQSEITGFESSFNETFVLVKEKVDDENVWKCTSHTDLALYDDSVDTVTDAFISLKGEAIDNIKAEDYGEYGFIDGKSDVYMTVTLKDGTTRTVYVGDGDLSGKNYYLRVEGVEEVIYKVSNVYASGIMVQKQNLINLKIFTFGTSDLLKAFSVKTDGLITFDATSSEVDGEGSAVWKVTVPAVRDANDSSLNERITAMRNLPLAGIAAEDCTELSEYGLDVPVIEYYLKTEDSQGVRSEHRIAIGNKTPDSGYYYCTIDESGTVYTVLVDYVYRDFDSIAYLDATLFTPHWKTLSKVEVEYKDKTYQLRFEYEGGAPAIDEAQDSDVSVEIFYNGKLAPDDDRYEIVTSDNSFKKPTDEQSTDPYVVTDNPDDCARQILYALYVISYSAFEPTEPTEVGAQKMKITYTQTDGTVREIKLMVRDNTTAYVYVNGVYSGGYCKTSSFDGNDFEKGNFMAAIKAVETVMQQVP